MCTHTHTHVAQTHTHTHTPTHTHTHTHTTLTCTYPRNACMHSCAGAFDGELCRHAVTKLIPGRGSAGSDGARAVDLSLSDGPY